MTSLICSVRPENFTEEVMAEKRLVLLIFMLPDDTYPGQLKIAEDVAKKYHQDLVVGLPAEESMETFKKKFSIIGTPTFLLMRQGVEVNRLYGVTDHKTITHFIEQHLKAYQ